LGFVLASTQAGAQATTSLQTDATVLPRHQFGVRVLTAFSRYDALLGNGGTRNIASSLSVDSLTSAQIAGLSATQTGLQALVGSAVTLSAGNVVAGANGRTVTAPLILEYGLTSRLTVGVVVPLVETRTTLFAQFNPALGAANVGLNPGANGWATNAQLVASLRTAATALSARLASCTAAPSGAGCTELLAQQSQAQALIAQTTPIANGIETVYGVSSASPGQTFVPLNSSTLQSTVNARVQSLRASYQALGGSVADLSPIGAGGPIAHQEMQALLETAGYDSLSSRDRSSIGDITIGGTYQLANSFADSARLASGAILYRLAVNAGFRIGTGEPASRNRLFDNATGYGQPGVILGAASDLRLRRRVFATVIGSYTKQLGSIDVTRVPNAGNALFPLTAPMGGTYTAGDEIALTVIPRYRLAGLFTLDGIYSLRHIAADSYSAPVPPGPTALMSSGLVAMTVTGPPGIASATGHQVGFGLTYSSSLSDRNPGRLPYEASFRHLETIAATGGPINKTFTDQIQLRVFFR
jgi:hypothetical protein